MNHVDMPVDFPDDKPAARGCYPQWMSFNLGRITGQLWIAVSTSMASSLPVFGVTHDYLLDVAYLTARLVLVTNMLRGCV